MSNGKCRSAADAIEDADACPEARTGVALLDLKRLLARFIGWAAWGDEGASSCSIASLRLGSGGSNTTSS
jgi:hypothetical protein